LGHNSFAAIVSSYYLYLSILFIKINKNKTYWAKIEIKLFLKNDFSSGPTAFTTRFVDGR